MKLDDYKKKLNGALSSDSLPNVVVEVLQDIEQDLTERDALKTQVSELTEQNNNLRDVNSKLALRITAPVDNHEDEEEHEPTPEESLTNLVNMIKEENNG